MVEYGIALMSKLDGINRHSFNNFRLRVGEFCLRGTPQLTQVRNEVQVLNSQRQLSGQFVRQAKLLHRWAISDHWREQQEERSWMTLEEMKDTDGVKYPVSDC